MPNAVIGAAVESGAKETLGVKKYRCYFNRSFHEATTVAVVPGACSVFCHSRLGGSAHHAGSIEAGIDWLFQSDRTIFADVEGVLIDHMNQLPPAQKEALHLVGEMQRTPVHMFLHDKNRELVPKVAQTLREMAADWLIEFYREQALNQ